MQYCAKFLKLLIKMSIVFKPWCKLQILLLLINKQKLTYRSETTSGEGISNVSLNTRAGSNMVDHLALSIDTTQARAWVNTMQVPAGTCRRTIRVDCTFRSACNVWISKIVLDACASCSSVTILAQGILTARWWVARVRTLGWDYWCWNYKHSCSNMLYDIQWAVIVKHSIHVNSICNQSINMLFITGVPNQTKFWDANSRLKFLGNIF